MESLVINSSVTPRSWLSFWSKSRSGHIFKMARSIGAGRAVQFGDSDGLRGPGLPLRDIDPISSARPATATPRNAPIPISLTTSKLQMSWNCGLPRTTINAPKPEKGWQEYLADSGSVCELDCALPSLLHLIFPGGLRLYHVRGVEAIPSGAQPAKPGGQAT